MNSDTSIWIFTRLDNPRILWALPFILNFHYLRLMNRLILNMVFFRSVDFSLAQVMFFLKLFELSISQLFPLFDLIGDMWKLFFEKFEFVIDYAWDIICKRQNKKWFYVYFLVILFHAEQQPLFICQVVIALYSAIQFYVLPFLLRVILLIGKTWFTFRQIFYMPLLEPRVPNEIAFREILVLGDTPVLPLFYYLFDDLAIISWSYVEFLLESKIYCIHFILVVLWHLILRIWIRWVPIRRIWNCRRRLDLFVYQVLLIDFTVSFAHQHVLIFCVHLIPFFDCWHHPIRLVDTIAQLLI